MATIILDTSVLIEFEQSNQEIIKKFLELEEQFQPNFAITFVNHAELYFGSLQKGMHHSIAVLDFLSRFNFLTATPLTSKIYSEIRYLLEKHGETIPPFDILTAAITMENSATLITMDKHFEKVPGLKYIII